MGPNQYALAAAAKAAGDKAAKAAAKSRAADAKATAKAEAARAAALAEEAKAAEAAQAAKEAKALKDADKAAAHNEQARTAQQLAIACRDNVKQESSAEIQAARADMEALLGTAAAETQGLPDEGTPDGTQVVASEHWVHQSL